MSDSVALAVSMMTGMSAVRTDSFMRRRMASPSSPGSMMSSSTREGASASHASQNASARSKPRAS